MLTEKWDGVKSDTDHDEPIECCMVDDSFGTDLETAISSLKQFFPRFFPTRKKLTK